VTLGFFTPAGGGFGVVADFVAGRILFVCAGVEPLLTKVPVASVCGLATGVD
jgi:hypothetical protein